MPLTPFPLEQFGGLNVAADPVDIGLSGAVDLLNVDFGRLGALRTRPGATKLNSTTPSSTGYLGLFGIGAGSAYAGSTPGVMAVRRTGTNQTAVEVVTSAGVVTTIGPTAGVAGWGIGSFATYGTLGGTTPLVFYSRWGPSTGFVLQRMPVDGASPPADVASLEKPWFVANWSTQNRLVQGGYFAAADSPSAANGSNSTIFFSDPNSEFFPSTNWVTFRPNDSEALTGIVSWGELLFAFKNSVMAVFGNVGTLSDGTAVFNERAVSLPDVILPRQGTYAPAVVAGPDGVYIACRGGIYRTTGGAPLRISDQVRGIFDINDTSVSSSIRSNGSPMSLSWIGTKLYCNYTTQASASRWLVFDAATGQWTLWAIPSSSGTTMVALQGQGATNTEDVFTIVGNDIHKISRGSTADDAGAIAWSYTTGYSSAGGYFRQRIVSSGERKKHFKTDIIGSGTVTHQLLTLNGRPNDVADTGAAVTLGTAPAIARGSRRRGVRGTHFAQKLSGSGPVVISGLTYWLSEISLDT
jgi:hypothetical protein